MHHHDVRFGGIQPAGQLVLVDELAGKGASMAFVLAVVGETTVGSSVRPYKVGVPDVRGLELAPEDGAPTTLVRVSSTSKGQALR
jgi:hypothetical protein